MTRLRFGLVAVLLLVSLALSNVWLARNPASSEPIRPSAQGSVADQSGLLDPFVAPQGVQFSEARERPIFAASRRPWSPPVMAEVVAPQAAPVAVEAPPSAAPIELSLIGVQRFPDGAQALVRKMGETAAQWVRSGDSLDGWTVEEIASESIRISAGGSTRTFELYPAASGAPL